MINPNWVKYIHSSIVEYFSVSMVTEGLPFHLEGADRVGIDNNPSWVELRIDGPSYYDLGGGQYRAAVEVNLLISTITEPQQNLYAHSINCGKVQQYMTMIPLMDYSIPTQIACLTLDRRKLELNNFGKVQDRTNMEQSTIEGHFDAMLGA